MRCHSTSTFPTHPFLVVLIVIVAHLGIVHAQGGSRTFSTRPLRGGPPQPALAVLQGNAVLPCDIRPPGPNDSAILVIWYKNDVTPIYSYDMRGKHSEQSSHWKDKEYLNERAYFSTVTEPAALNIDHVEERDEGEYRCRVDFTKSPTRNSRIHLTVVVPPHKPNIIDERGKTVPTVAGPYEEDGDMRLTCLVSGGRPEPTVLWWRGETLLESKDGPGEFPALRRNILVVSKLSRSDLHAVFTCQATNNNISQPLSASVAIEMHLRPLTVSILSSEHAPLSADRKYEIACMTAGSRPPAKLFWYLDGKRLDNFTVEVSQDGNTTTSTLTLKPTLLDHDKVLTCRAENSRVRDGVEEDTWKLNVWFVPILHLELGSNMNPDDIEEGDDVYFECKVLANPWPYKVVWRHNGNVIQNKAKDGVIVQQYDLALRNVSRSQAGNYTCIASNTEGDGYSNSVELKIMYKPICVSDQKRIYGVARHEDARIICQVEAYPPPDSFRWAFNNTEEMVDVPQARYKSSTRHTQSVLTYRPVTEMDYGTVLCWASNTAGQQKNACVFHIIPAGKPESPYNCTLTNQTTDSLSVACTAGFDGGQPQHFLLEVFDQHTGLLQANVTSRENAAASFTVRGLEPGKVLNMVLYAVNAKGRSDPTLLEGFTLKIAEKQTGSPVPFEITPLLGVLIGVVTALLLVTTTILGALKMRSDRKAGRPDDLPLKKVSAPTAEDLYDADDRNPDVVPTNKDSDYQLTGSTAGTPLAGQSTPDALSTALGTSLSLHQPNHHHRHHQHHHQGLPAYPHADYTNYPTLPLSSGEVTYAELCLARPTTLSTGADPKVGGLAALSGHGGGLGVIIGGGSISGTGNCGSISSGRLFQKEATVYACIDHNAKAALSDASVVPSVTSPTTATTVTSGSILSEAYSQDSNISGGSLGKQQLHHPREVVTVRTPLISTQESCV
ncbi:synaptogenesis protein syg-2 isoform X3 [Cephus cinctus]|uniref:Synaptogenesis protein syg-2 isoform X3 n=1 Tax=Cephus cinctus TaxID=211228 RepID=A0AAJ7BLY0_CEPCN|nr:synaptogenesis protein syg-2 isoform X3 [Cephus cinctus]